MTENIKSILGLETEGFEKTFDQFEKISDLKDSLEGKTRLEASYKANVDVKDLEKEIKIKPVTETGAEEKENIFSRMRDAFKLPAVFGDERTTKIPGVDEKDEEEKKKGDKWAKSLDKNSKSLMSSARAMETLDPTTLIKSFTSQKYGFISSLASSAANAIWGGTGEGVKAAIMKVAELKNIALGAAQNSINAFKQTLPTEIGRRADAAFSKLYQGDLKSSEFKEITRADYANIMRTVSSQYGKLQPEFIKQIRKIYGSEKGNIINRELAASLAQGKFSALGTDRGFFMEKIAGASAGLPPSVRQNINASLLDQVDLSSLKLERGAARRTGKQFDESNIKLAQNTFNAMFSGKGSYKNIMQANEQLNSLSLIMVKNASMFSGILKSSAEDLNGFMKNLNTLITSAERAATKAAKNTGKTQKFNTRMLGF